MAYADIGDLESAVGGAQNLRQLADPLKTGVLDEGIALGYLESGAAEVRSAVEVKHDPETVALLDAPSLKRLSDANAAISARIAYEQGGQGMAMPEWVEKKAERADKFLDDLAKGFRRLGRVSGGAAAAINQPAGTVDHDPLGCGISVAGFKKGFR